MEEPFPPDPGPSDDPFSLVGQTADGAWTITVRTVASPTGLKVWSLNIEPAGLLPGNTPPDDAPGAGINTGVLKKVRFPEIRRELTRRTGEYLARILDELEEATPEDREIMEQELVRAHSEVSRSIDPTMRRGRPADSDDTRAQWALDVLATKDQSSYRKTLRNLWSQREEKPRLKTRTVDTRMVRLGEDGWLIGYGKNSVEGPKLEQWLTSHSLAPHLAEQE
jgi:hypothetical protein